MSNNQTAEVRVLALISREGEALEAYKGVLKQSGVEVVHAPSVGDFFRLLPEIAINGFLIDVPAMIRITPNERVLLQGIESIFPNMRVNWNQRAGFRTLFNDKSKPGEESLKAFVEQCLQFTPRPLRKNKRKEMHLNVLLWRENEPQDSAARTFTCDISREGAFIGTCGDYEVGSTVGLILKELSPKPIQAVVKGKRTWGKSMMIPGFGCRFTSLDEEQATALEGMLI